MTAFCFSDWAFFGHSHFFVTIFPLCAARSAATHILTNNRLNLLRHKLFERLSQREFHFSRLSYAVLFPVYCIVMINRLAYRPNVWTTPGSSVHFFLCSGLWTHQTRKNSHSFRADNTQPQINTSCHSRILSQNYFYCFRIVWFEM